MGGQTFSFNQTLPGIPAPIRLNDATGALMPGGHINLFYLVLVTLGWVLVYQAIYWALAIVRDPSLICWGVGPFGLIIVTLRKPGPGLRLIQLVAAGLALASVADASLFLARPGPITGLSQTPLAELGVVALVVALATGVRLLANVRMQRFPLWGEARVLATVQQNVARGAILVFTPLGRAFLRERFGATPGEFIQTMRS
ncbi:MAG TPA: hypothetical protein VKQ36_09505 [Ktedonobacterales bacterium]|nr:hypothetical protein [Ktedonobacterales bacterium]